MTVTHGRIELNFRCCKLLGSSKRRSPHRQAAASLSHRCKLLQRCHINYKAVLHVALEQAVVCFVDLLNFDHLDVRGNSLFPAEIEHLLRFAKPADARAGKPATVQEQTEG